MIIMIIKKLNNKSEIICGFIHFNTQIHIYAHFDIIYFVCGKNILLDMYVYVCVYVCVCMYVRF